MQENCITSKKGCPICNKLRQNSHSPWLYEINQKIIDNTRDLIITERKIIERKQKSNTNKSGILTHYEKYYKYKCNKCGYSDGWKVESSIKSGQGCACCSIPAKVVVSGVNDIPTTDPWMIPYFQGKEQEASLYTAGSMKKLNFQCPDCGKIRKKKIAIGTLKINKGIGCECSDSISYPEKFFTSVLEQLNISYYREFLFKGYKYRYDFICYSQEKNQLFIVETDGGLGHGNVGWDKTIQTSRKLLLRDLDKMILALSYQVPVIHVDCTKSDKEYIKNSILSNENLKKYIDCKNINWDMCDQFATKNIVKEICLEFNQIQDIEYLSKKYKIHKATIKKYIKKGYEYKWITK